MSKNVQLIILHIAVAVLCFIGALVFFNNRMGMEKGSAVAELANPSYPCLLYTSRKSRMEKLLVLRQ